MAWRLQGSDGGFHICKGTEQGENLMCAFRAAHSGSKQEVKSHLGETASSPARHGDNGDIETFLHL